MNKDRYFHVCRHTQTSTQAGGSLCLIYCCLCLLNRSTLLRGRTSASWNCLTHRLKLSVRLKENLWTGCWASAVWRWELPLCGDGGWMLILRVFIWGQCHKIFARFLDQTDVDGEDGEGKRGTGSGRSQHHRPAREHTHPRSVWPTGENLGPRSAAETGQTHDVTSHQLRWPTQTIWKCDSLCKHTYTVHMSTAMSVWAGLNIDKCVYSTGEVCSLVPSASLPGGPGEDGDSSWVSRSEHRLTILCVFFLSAKSRMTTFDSLSPQCPTVPTRERLTMALWF